MRFKRQYSLYSQIELEEKDVVHECIKEIDHNACDNLWPYDALKVPDILVIRWGITKVRIKKGAQTSLSSVYQNSLCKYRNQGTLV